VLMWQTIIHVVFLLSALAIAATDRLMAHSTPPARHWPALANEAPPGPRGFFHGRRAHCARVYHRRKNPYFRHKSTEYL